MTARVVFTLGSGRLGGVREVTVEAKRPIREGFEVFFIPGLEGG